MTEKIISYHLHVIEECPFCKAAVDLLSSGPHEYSVSYYDWDDTTLNEVKQNYNHPTVPIISKRTKVGDEEVEELIGGYTELVRYFEKEGE